MKWLIKNFEELISGAALVMVVMVVIFNVISRYIFNISFNWAEEIAAIGFAWCVFVGASACYKRHMHIGIDAFITLLPDKISNIILAITNISLILVNAYLTYLSLVFSISAWIKPTAVLTIPYTFVDISSTIGFGLMTIHSIRFFIKDLKLEK